MTTDPDRDILRAATVALFVAAFLVGLSTGKWGCLPQPPPTSAEATVRAPDSPR